ncbi:PD-(D/E)XK nuclease superfamily protein [Paenibacillus sp. yr247]|uniref:PD-(D/E)XK nuclease family protein n=1 Tax=Paenibacillus sp. yr247 TaxID=1761880 RepID=UPI0008830205|nr:PD-(D/E)XK nuclease family protein [Paenibacillus sp. yr247]SDO86807.1 PD-(D/E)XK nuclease superfamily protein [Paenibacillus sp. yr247]
MSSTFIRNLHESFEAYPLSKKVFLAPRFADGQQWLHQVCRDYGHVLNVEVQTIESLALKQAALKLFQQKKRVIRPKQSFWIIQQIMMELTKGEDPYLSEAMITPGMVSCFHRSIEDLRQAFVHAKDLELFQFIDHRKGAYLREVLLRYEKILQAYHFVDQMLISQLVDAEKDGTMFIMPENSLLTKAQQTTLQTIAGERLVKPKFGLPFTATESDFPADKAQLFHATGSLAEVREVMRRVLSHENPLDQVEVIASNYEAYASTFHTLTSELDISCTYGGGLPLQYARMGRTLLKLLHWLENDFPIADFIALLRDGGLSLRNVDESIPSSEWIRSIENLHIGWGKERYVDLLESIEDGVTAEEKPLLDNLRKVFQGILTKWPSDDAWSPTFMMTWLQQIITKYGAIQNEDDALIVKELDELVASLTSVNAISSSGMKKDVALQYVAQLLSGIRVKVASTPTPGAIHISSLSGGGLTGRHLTYMVGMDEHNWSAASRQDPVLLDEERQSISANLTLTSERSRNLKINRDRRIGSITGDVTLSYSSYQLAEGKQASPAFELLQIFRNKHQLSNADYSVMGEALGMPVSYLSHKAVLEENSLPVDSSDQWTIALTDEQGRMRDGRGKLNVEYPHMNKGSQAVMNRISNEITAHDGFIQSVTLVAEMGQRAFSASQLERYAECPMRFYFGYVLGIWSKDEAVYNRTRWLEPMDRGNLLHRIFYEYLRQITAVGSSPANHDRSIMQSITEEQLTYYNRLVPAPSQHILQKESDEIRQDVEWFYNEELTKTTRPIYFEQELTIDGEPMQLKLTDGSIFTIKGFIDRIDQIEPHCYRIIDYKTGSPGKYRDNAYFAGGTQLQHALYALAAEQWLKDTGRDRDAQVTESAYYFPTARGVGREVVRLQDKRELLTGVLRSLLTSMEQGLYIPTEDAKRCRYCDYATVCVNHASFMGDKKGDPDNAVKLKVLLEVEAVE